MSKQAEAELILKLYELRRDETMRKARDWFFRDFHPDSVQDVVKEFTGEHSGHLRMVMSYWDMCASLVHYGSIDLQLFVDTTPEFIGCFTKLEPFLGELRKMFDPRFLSNLEKLIDTMPEGRKRVADFRERMKMVRAMMAQRQQAAKS